MDAKKPVTASTRTIGRELDQDHRPSARQMLQHGTRAPAPAGPQASPPDANLYVCANPECGVAIDMKPGAVFVCTTCGHRILYKMRVPTERGKGVQFEAR